MTEVIHSRVDGEHILIVRGHAGYGASGADIVCAGLSAITYTLMGWLTNNEPRASMKDEPGLSIVISPETEKADTAFEMAVIGYMQIAAKYPNNVTVYIPE